MRSEAVTEAWEFYRDNCPGFKEPMRKKLRELDEYVSRLEARPGSCGNVGERYVVLPADANGATIRPGARVTHAGKTWVVRTLMLTDEGEWLLDCQPEDGVPITGRTVRPRDCKVLEERTVEDVLLEFLGAMADATEGDARDVEAAEDAAIRRYADEIRQILGVQS